MIMSSSSTPPSRKDTRSSAALTPSTMATMSTVKESLSEAIKLNDVETVKALLVSHRGMINLNNLEKDEIYSHLMLASLQGTLEVAKVLIEQGRADPNLQNKDGQSALMFASYKGHVELVRYLAEKGARKDFTDNVGQSAMDLAANDEVRFILDPSLQPLIDSATDEQSGQVDDLAKESLPEDFQTPQRNQSVLKYVFNEKELSSIVQQAQDVNASSVDLTPARLREKEKQLGQCEALLKDAKARIADLEKQRIDATLAYEAEIGVLYNRVEFLTSDLTASNDELSQLKNKLDGEEAGITEMTERVKLLEQELNVTTAELDLEKCLKLEKEKENMNLLTELQIKLDRIDQLEAKVNDLEGQLQSSQTEHALLLELQVAERESMILAEQQRLYETRINAKDLKIAQLESLVTHLSGELDDVVRSEERSDMKLQERNCDPSTCVVS